MVLQHEYQHNETILQTLQLKHGRALFAGAALRCACRPGSGLPADPGRMLRFPGGPVEIGTDDRSAAYDNERDRHVVQLAPFWIDRASGHQRRLRGLHRGRRILERGSTGRMPDGIGSTSPARQAPKYWSQVDDCWMTRSMDQAGPVRAVTPGLSRVLLRGRGLCAVCGKAASDRAGVGSGRVLGPRDRHQAQLSLGRASQPSKELANVDQLSFGTAPVGSYPRERVAHRAVTGMIGDVWEWTVERFHPVSGVRELSLRGVLGGLLRQRVQGAPWRLLGHPPRRHSQHLPQLGLPYPPPDLQRLPVCPR